MLDSPHFVRSSLADHQAACRAIELDAAWEELFDVEVGYLEEMARLGGVEEQLQEPELGHRKEVTQIGVRLCDSGQERAFVRALVVLTRYELGRHDDGLVRMTFDQIRRVYADRSGGQKPANPQIDRLMRKYVRRPGKPARRFELLEQVSRGRRRRGRTVGTPSEYRPTGIVLLLGAVPERAGSHADAIAA